jgi:hypothetical protein
MIHLFPDGAKCVIQEGSLYFLRLASYFSIFYSVRNLEKKIILPLGGQLLGQGLCRQPTDYIFKANILLCKSSILVL